jgi:pimeloyl-ACP methyl ester carboxylesterase
MENKSIVFEGVNIFYKIYGKGKAVMLVHGFGEDGTVWQNQIQVLQKDFFLIVPDLPGSGLSKPLKNNADDLVTYAKVLHAILVEENITNCIMLGHSMGGYITLYFAKLFPKMLYSFGLVHSTALPDSEAKKETRKKAIEFINENGSKAFLKTTIPTLFFDKIKNKNSIDKLINESDSFLPETLVNYYNAMINRADNSAVLKNSPVPVLFIIGKADLAVPFADVMPQTYLPNVSYIKILENAAHMGMQEASEEVNTILANFLHYSLP